MRVILGVILAWLVVGGAVAAERVALVVANARYAAVPDLANPPNDARAVSRALERVGFAVTQVENAGSMTVGNPTTMAAQDPATVA